MKGPVPELGTPVVIQGVSFLRVAGTGNSLDCGRCVMFSSTPENHPTCREALKIYNCGDGFFVAEDDYLKKRLRGEA